MTVIQAPATFFSRFTLAQVQLEPATDDKVASLQHARDMIIKAASGNGEESRRPDLIMLPEYFNSLNTSAGHKMHAEYVPDVPTGTNVEPADLPPKSATLQMLSRVARETRRYIVGGSMPEIDPENDTRIFNTMTVWDPDGRCIGKYRKVHLYDVDIPGGITYRESDVISSGTTPLIVNFPFGTIALAICFDIRFQYYAAALCESASVCAYLLPAAFNMTTGPKAWEVLQRARAIDNQIYVGMCSPSNKAGEEYVAYGHTMLADCEGKVISSATPEDQSETIVYATLDPAHVTAVRNGVPTLSAKRLDVYDAPRLKI